MIMKFQVMRDIAAGSHHARALSSRHILVMCAMSRRSLLLKFINRFLFWYARGGAEWSDTYKTVTANTDRISNRYKRELG